MTPDARLTEITQFLGYALGQWPQERARLGAGLTRRCRGCLLNERAAVLVDGRCEACRELAASSRHALQRGLPGAVGVLPDRLRPTSDQDALAELDAILYTHQGCGRGTYDAMVLFSGGKDSTYLLQRLRQEYPQLRLLAVMIDNGFASSIARGNVERVSRILDLDVQILRPKPSLFQKTFRHALTHLHSGGCYATVDRMDGDLTFDLGRNLAATLEIPLVVAGMSREQVELIFGFAGCESPPEQERRRRTTSAGFQLESLYTPQEQSDCWWDGTRVSPQRLPRVLYPLHAWNPSESHIRSEIARLGLLAPGQDNPLATNSDLVPVMLAVDSARLGYSSFEPEFARMVREGKAERETWLNIFQALEYTSAQGRFLPGCIDETLERLQLTRQQLGIPLPTDALASHA